MVVSKCENERRKTCLFAHDLFALDSDDIAEFLGDCGDGGDSVVWDGRSCIRDESDDVGLSCKEV